MNALIQSLMGQLQSKNAGNFKLISEMMRNGGNPDAFLKQILGNINPEQRQKILNQARGYGVPDSYLSQIQSMK